MADLTMWEHRAISRNPAIFPYQVYRKGRMEIDLPIFYEPRDTVHYAGCSVVEVITDDGFPRHLVFQMDSNGSQVSVDYLGGFNFRFSNITRAEWVGLVDKDTFRPKDYIKVWDLKRSDQRDPVVDTPEKGYIRKNQIVSLDQAGTFQNYNEYQEYKLCGGSGGGAKIMTGSVTNGAPDSWEIGNPGKDYQVGDLLKVCNDPDRYGTGVWRVTAVEDEIFYG